MLALRDRLQKQYSFDQAPRIGAAGGISTPWSAAGAFAMGASYVVVGSASQGCVESGTSDTVRKMLAQAQQADIAMAPAADMFEMGVRVQVLKRGTMFAMRAAKLYEYYRAYDSIDAIPPAERATLEKTYFKAPLETIWDQTRTYFRDRDPAQVERAGRDPKHLMALVFRWYLGKASHWANAGDPTRAVDYQVWCGPAMAAFNEWVRGTFLERPEERRVALVARNILYGAAVLTRARALAAQGMAIPPGVPDLARCRWRKSTSGPSYHSEPDSSPAPVAPPSRPPFEDRPFEPCRADPSGARGHHRDGLPVPQGRQPRPVLDQHPRRRRRDPRDPRVALEPRRPLRRRPQGPRQDLRPPGRLPRPRRLPRARLRDRPGQPRRHRHHPAARLDGRPRRAR